MLESLYFQGKTVFADVNQQTLNKEQNITILLVEQNAKAALAAADRGYVLKNGAIVMEGSGEDLLNNDDIRKAYLGENVLKN